MNRSLQVIKTDLYFTKHKPLQYIPSLFPSTPFCPAPVYTPSPHPPAAVVSYTPPHDRKHFIGRDTIFQEKLVQILDDRIGKCVQCTIWFCYDHNRELVNISWAPSSEFGTYRLCEQRRFRRGCASAQSRQNLCCSLIQVVSQEEPSDRKPDP